MMDRIVLPTRPEIETWPIILYPAVETGMYQTRALVYATISRISTEGFVMECRGVFAGAEELELVTFQWS